MFKLLRYFSFSSAIIVVLVTGLLAYFYQKSAVSNLTLLIQEQNVVLARSFSNIIWPKYAAYVKSIGNFGGEALRARPETEEIHKTLQELTKGLPVLKVKMYNLEGLTVYSSEFSQIGVSKSADVGFQATLRRDNPTTKSSFRDTFPSFEGPVTNRHLIESYLPIRGLSGETEGVFELYADVTPMITEIRNNTTTAVFYLLLGLGLLYGALLLIVLRADRIMKEQFNTLEHEVVERQSAELKLKTALDEAKAANRAKSNFLATMSHEVRTPLTSSLGSLGLLSSVMSDQFSEEGRNLLDIALRNNQALLRLVNELLDYEKVLSGTLVIETSSHDIRALTSNVVKDLQGYAQTLSVNFVFDDHDQPVFAKVQAHRYEQILNNLLSNAAKFSKPDSDIVISVKSAEGAVVTCIKDTGPGIPEEFRETIYEQFTQIDGSSTRQHGGTGLGLAISKALSERMEGSLYFDTVVGVGSTFYMRFPESSRPQL